MSSIIRPAVLILLSGVLLASAAAAATTRHASRVDWTNAVGVFTLEDFESTPPQSPPCAEQDLEYGGCRFSATVETDAFEIILPAGWHSGGYDGVFEEGVINGTREYRADLHAGVLVDGTYYNTVVFSSPITAFAVDLAGVEDEVCFLECTPILNPMTIRIAGTDHPVAYGSTFFGLTSDQPFSEVVWMNTRPGQGGFIIPSFDNVAFVPVPAPSTGVLLGLGLLALARLR